MNRSEHFDPSNPCLACEGVGYVPSYGGSDLFEECERCKSTGNEDVAQALSVERDVAAAA